MRRLICITAVALCFSPTSHAAELTVAGAWTLNRELTQLPPEGEARRLPEGERGAGRGGRVGGGRGGGGRAGGIGGRGLGGFGGAKPDEDNLRRIEAIRRRLTDIPDRLIITRSADGVSITDGFGRSYSLKTDGKKQDRVTGDGEFTSKSRFDSAKLIVEDDFDGPKVTTTYTPILDGGEITRLVVTLKAENMPGSARERLAGPRGAAREIRRVYDLDAR
jgi:hypothetical protein